MLKQSVTDLDYDASSTIFEAAGEAVKYDLNLKRIAKLGMSKSMKSSVAVFLNLLEIMSRSNTYL
jgi:hypothetical protein